MNLEGLNIEKISTIKRPEQLFYTRETHHLTFQREKFNFPLKVKHSHVIHSRCISTSTM